MMMMIACQSAKMDMHDQEVRMFEIVGETNCLQSEFSTADGVFDMAVKLRCPFVAPIS